MLTASGKTSWIDDACEAVRFLTVLRLPSKKALPENALARAMIFFPAVGTLIGGFTLGLFHLFQPAFPANVAALVLLMVPILISGGLHVDGFADFCDGFFGGKERTDTLRIMKDSRVGAWGALGVALLVLVKYELLLALPGDKTRVFLLAMAASRWAQVLLSFTLPYAGLGGGMSERVAGKISLREIWGATVFLLLPVFGLGLKGFFILTGTAIFIFVLGFLFKKRLGGVTGDLLGAASEMTEVIVLLLAVSGT